MIKYLLIVIFAILADVVCNNSIIQLFEIQGHFTPLLLIIGMVGLQILAAPIQAGFSDFYCRRKSLIVALGFSFLSLLFLSTIKSTSSISLVFLLLSLVFNACLGNTVPIAWSALADVQQKKLRFYLGLTTTAYASGYIALALFGKTAHQKASENSWLWQDIILPLGLIGVSLILVWKLYRDLRDKKPRLQNKQLHFKQLALSEFTSLLEELKSRSTLFGLWAYFSWACSQYSVLLFLLESQQHTATVVIMMVGYFAGITILGFKQKVADKKIIRYGYVVTILSILLFFISNPLMHDREIMLAACGFLYTLGNAFLTPTLFSLFSKEREIHEQGKGFGLIVSADSAGFLIGVILVQIFNSSKIGPEYLVAFSSVVFLFSWYPYLIYEKTRKNAARIETANE